MTPVDEGCAYGPVPSRRLGKSLGINNIPAKVCSYACVYCQAGRTLRMEIVPRRFYDPEAVLQAVRGRLEKARAAAEPVNYLAFVPDGEPTLDLNLAAEITQAKILGIPVAVITNSSLMWREDVREALSRADWVSLKLDAVQEAIWQRINRPHRELRLRRILDGMLAFAKTFTGKLVTETMLVRGCNDQDSCVRDTADFLRELQPAVAYLSIPTRPPAEPGVRGPEEDVLNRIYQTFAEKIKHVEYLIGYEGDAFAFTGDVEKDLLSITAVHPMRKEAVDLFLSRAGASWKVVEEMLARGVMAETEHAGHTFYIRKFMSKREAGT